MSRLPEPLQFLLNKHREMIRFAVVGGTTFLIDNGVWYALKLTVLTDKVVTAKVIGVLVAIIASYVLSREWSFHTRGGRERHHEAALFFLVSEHRAHWCGALPYLLLLACPLLHLLHGHGRATDGQGPGAGPGDPSSH